MAIELPRMIGNSANMPDANGPMTELAVVTAATTTATATARSGISKRLRTNFFGSLAVR